MEEYAASPPDVRKASGFPLQPPCSFFAASRLSLDAVKVIRKLRSERQSLSAHQAAEPPGTPKNLLVLPQVNIQMIRKCRSMPLPAATKYG